VDIQSLLGAEADSLLNHEAKGIPKEGPQPPRAPTTSIASCRSATASPQVLRNLQTLFDHGRLGGTGYVSILPVDQGIEHSAAGQLRPNPKYFDPANIVELAIEGGCQRRGQHLRRARRGVTQVRPPHPVSSARSTTTSC